MVTIRLNSLLRRRIKNKLAQHAFGPKQKELEAICVSLGDTVYYLKYPNENPYNKYAGYRMVDMPDNWLMEDHSMYVNASGYSIYLNFSSPKRVPCSFSRYDQFNITDASVINKIQKYCNEDKLLKEEQTKLTNKISCFLASISTVKQFYEQMPEAVDILGSDFFGTVEPSTALVTTAKEIMCEIAHIRKEEKTGCCEGKVIA